MTELILLALLFSQQQIAPTSSSGVVSGMIFYSDGTRRLEDLINAGLLDASFMETKAGFDYSILLIVFTAAKVRQLLKDRSDPEMREVLTSSGQGSIFSWRRWVLDNYDDKNPNLGRSERPSPNWDQTFLCPINKSSDWD